MTVLLPPDVDLSTVGCSQNARYDLQDGEWTVEPAPSVGTWDKQQARTVAVWPPGKTIVQGRDVEIYGTDAFWPSDQARILTTGCLRRWRLAEVALPLVRFNPVTGRLVKLHSAQLAVTYTRQETPLPPAVGSLAGKDRVEKMAVNFREASQEYAISDRASYAKSTQKAKRTEQDWLTESSQSPKGYVILTTSAIRNASEELLNFVSHKESLGFTTVKVVTESSTVDDDHYLSGSTYDERAGNIREWLQSHYDSDQILYVLLIGNPDPTSFNPDTSVPMKMCTSNPNNPNNHPTDYFFAELTADWDKDGDGLYGEIGIGAADGNEVETFFEVYVGRIPYYNSISDLDHILRKTIDYENSTEVQWRRNVLLPMVPFDVEKGVLSYELGEQIKQDHLEPEGIPSVRIYDECYADVMPPPEYLRRNRYPATEWKQGTYGLVVWLNHGGSTDADRIISSPYTTRLDDNHPSATWQGTCDNASPGESDNLAYSILRHGGIASVGATGGVNYRWPKRNYRDLTGGVGPMGYKYAKRTVQRQTCGQALYNAKEEFEGDIWLGNYYSLNLYGDPSVVVMPEAPAFTVSPTDAFYSRSAYSNASSCGRMYTLRNMSDSPLDWAASHAADWLELSSHGGRINPNASVVLEIGLTTKIADLDYGTHEDTVIFKDSTNGILIERSVVLEIYPQQLAGYWRLDETGGSVVKDSAGTNDGALQGNPQWQPSEGRIGGALLFDETDDSNDYVNCGHSSVFDITDAITVAAWVTIDTVNKDWQTIVAKGDSAWRLSTYQRTKRFHFAICGAPWVNVVDGGTEVSSGEWHHVCGTYDGANIRLYIDGIEDAASPVAYTGKIETNIYDVYIGENAEHAGRYWNGMIDDVRVYNRALDADEILAIMNGGLQAENRHPFDKQEKVPYRWTLSWVPSATAIYHDVYFGTSYDAVSSATASSREYKGRQSEVNYIPYMDVNTEYFWRIDEVVPGSRFPALVSGDVWSFATGQNAGTITRAVWTEITGSSVEDLTSLRDYPGRPNILEEIRSFEGPVNWADNYGTLIHGFLTPTRTGSYTFWIAGDNNCELWLSSDANPVNQAKIAEVPNPNWANPPEWEKYPEQQSDSITLTAGNSYYIKAIQKEGAGHDSISVSWHGPGISQRVIPGHYLAPYDLDPPLPDPMTWATPPHATGSRSISMTARTALDRGGVEYYFDCTLGGGHDSGWQDGPYYEDGDLSPDAEYTYVVTARDKSHNHNQTNPSQSFSARTLLAGDLELDGDVDFADYARLAGHFSSRTSTRTGDASEADLDDDGDIDLYDVSILMDSWLARQP